VAIFAFAVLLRVEEAFELLYKAPKRSIKTERRSKFRWERKPAKQEIAPLTQAARRNQIQIDF
jgi:hypothetical protein